MMNRVIDINSTVYTSAHDFFEKIRDHATKKQFEELKSKVKAINDYTVQDTCMRILKGADEWLTDNESVMYPVLSVKYDENKGTVTWTENENRVLFPYMFENAFDDLHALEVKEGKTPAEQTKYLFDAKLQAKINKAVRVCFGFVVRKKADDIELAKTFIAKYNENPRIAKHAVDENGKRVKDDYSKNSLSDALNACVIAICPTCTKLFANNIAENIADDMLKAGKVKTKLNNYSKLSDKAMQELIINRIYGHIIGVKMTIDNLK